MTRMSINVDGKAHGIDTDADMPLLHVLRDDPGLRDPKSGCYKFPVKQQTRQVIAPMLETVHRPGVVHAGVYQVADALI